MTANLIHPFLVPYWQMIEEVTMRTPFRQEIIDERNEPCIVSALKEMNHFMHHYVLQTLPGFFR